MPTISEAVEEVIKQSLLVEEAISKKIINISSFAREIREKIEERTAKKVSLPSIVMAIRRISHKIDYKKTKRSIFSRKMDMLVRSNLTQYILINSDKLISDYKRYIGNWKIRRDHFFTITEGVFETSLIVSKDLEKYIEKSFKDNEIFSKNENLAAIILKMPEESETTPGFFYNILKLIAWEKINIVDIASARLELTIIFAEKDVDTAFSVLKKSLNK